MAEKKMVACKTCGEMIAKNAKTCPHCGAKNKMKHPVLGVVLLVFGIMLFIAGLSGANRGGTPRKVEESSVASAVPTPAKDQEKTVFGVGEKVELNDVAATLVSVSTSKGSSFLKPSDGNEYVVFEFEIENGTKKDIAVSSMVSFEAYFDDYAANISLGAMTGASDKNQLDGTIAGGKKMQGVVGYETPEGWKTVEVKFNPNFWAGKKITFTATHP